MKGLLKHIVIWALLTVLGISCASISAPTGGPKDELPPVIEETEPPRGTVNFRDDEISLHFDEYTTVDQPTILVSPPLEEKPDFDLTGKTFTLEFNEELHENTTYTIYFFDGIKDLNEGNPIPYYDFTFSTGPVLDTMRIGGRVLDCQTGKPQEKVFVMAYESDEDSIPYKEKPAYLTRTDEEGHFSINNIPKKEYKLFALKDNNNNMLFDLPNEPIAFLDTLVLPAAETVFGSDTLFIRDSLVVDSITQDTVPAIDTIIEGYMTEYYPMDIKMQMFTEYYYNQYIASDLRKQWAQICIAFNDELDENFSYELLSPEPPPGKWYIEERSPENDSLVIWISDSTIYQTEELILRVSYTALDTNGERLVQNDTLNLKYSKKQEEADIRKGKLSKVEKIMFSPISFKELYNNGYLMSTTPITYIDTSLIRLYRKEDTLYVPEPYRIVPDSMYALKQHVVFNKMPDSSYRLIIDTLALTDVYYRHNDSTGNDFTVMNESNYGIISLLLTNLPSRQAIVVLSLGNTQSKRIETDGDGMIVMDKLLAGKYKLKVILDEDRNGEWSTGNYLEGKQPEDVLIYPEEVQVKGNFEQVIEWDLNPPKPEGEAPGDEGEGDGEGQD